MLHSSILAARDAAFISLTVTADRSQAVALYDVQPRDVPAALEGGALTADGGDGSLHEQSAEIRH